MRRTKRLQVFLFNLDGQWRPQKMILFFYGLLLIKLLLRGEVRLVILTLSVTLIMEFIDYLLAKLKWLMICDENNGGSN